MNTIEWQVYKIKGIFENFKDIYDSEQLALQRNKR